MAVNVASDRKPGLNDIYVAGNMWHKRLILTKTHDWNCGMRCELSETMHANKYFMVLIRTSSTWPSCWWQKQSCHSWTRIEIKGQKIQALGWPVAVGRPSARFFSIISSLGLEPFPRQWQGSGLTDWACDNTTILSYMRVEADSHDPNL